MDAAGHRVPLFDASALQVLQTLLCCGLRTARVFASENGLLPYTILFGRLCSGLIRLLHPSGFSFRGI